MSGMDFEYAIKKDIRNNPIVREVDQARQRQLWRTMAIGLFLVLVLLFSAWQHFELLRHGYQIERMQQERAAEEDVNRHLRLEVETLKSPRPSRWAAYSSRWTSEDSVRLTITANTNARARNPSVSPITRIVER